MSEIIMHPDYEKLYHEVGQLKQEVLSLLIEKDELLLHTCKNIETEYMLTVGALEYKVYEFECSVLRIRRKIELIRAKFNRQEAVFIDQIEQQLDLEFAEFQESLNEYLNDINESLYRNSSEFMKESDVAEIKRMYREIVKKLHPDINPNITPEQESLLVHAMEAYEMADIDTICTIYTLIDEISPNLDKTFSFDELKVQREQLLAMKESIILEIERIKHSFPYDQIPFLDDEEAVMTRKENLNQALEEYKHNYSEHEKILNEILGGNNG